MYKQTGWEIYVSMSVFCGRLSELILSCCGKVDWQDWSWPWEMEGRADSRWMVSFLGFYIYYFFRYDLQI